MTVQMPARMLVRTIVRVHDSAHPDTVHGSARRPRSVMTPQHDPIADPARWDGLSRVTSRPEPVEPGRHDADRHVVLGSAFDNAPVGMAVLTPSGVVAMVNAALGGLLGRTSADPSAPPSSR